MNASMAIQLGPLQAHDWPEYKVRCSMCNSDIEAAICLSSNSEDSRTCTACGSSIYATDGIWKAIPPVRSAQLEGSLSVYEAVRTAEGRWSENSEFYLSLPWKDTTGAFSEQWKIRATSFDFLQRNVLPEVKKRLGKEQLRVLDLGAGNCWMSYRLALSGHFPVAVDIGVGQKDGLGAAKHYESVLRQLFPRFQAEMDCLPFAGSQFDLAIYNASFHYANDYAGSIREVVRVLRPDGAILIVDSPTYGRESDGEAMVREKAAFFTGKFGTDSGGMGGQEYLTPERVARLGQIGIHWRRYSPWYGFRWALRPAAARLKGRRRPSQFYMYLGTLTPAITEAL